MRLGISISIFFLIVINYHCLAQEVTFSGTVKNESGTLLELVNVVATNQDTNELDGFGITNSNGAFNIHIKAKTKYNIRISFLGYSPYEFAIETSNKDLLKDIVLVDLPEELNEVEVTYQMPLRIKGDTIVYNADSFTNGSEKKLEDVLRKLPGVEVNDEGEVKVEGKKVNTLMIEGKPFFDGDTKMGTKNIPANVLDKIQVFRNYNSVNQLRNVTNNQDNLALNLKLKEGKDKFWFGDISIGEGVNNEYIYHPKIFYYSKKLSLSSITDINNVGELPFTTKDYLKYLGGFSMRRVNTGTTLSTNTEGIGISYLKNNKAKRINSKFSALNYSYMPSDVLSIGGYAIYSNTNTQLETLTNRSYIATNEIEKSKNTIDQSSKLGIAKFNVLYAPTTKLQWDYDFLYKNSKIDESRAVSSFVNMTDYISDKNYRDPRSIVQNTNLYYTLNDDNIIALKAQYLSKTNNPQYDLSRTQQPFLEVLPLVLKDTYELSQRKSIETNRFDLNIDYYYVLNQQSNLKLSLGVIKFNQNFNSSVYQIFENNDSQIITDADFTNDVAFKFLDYYTGLFYKLKLRKLTINPGIIAHDYRLSNHQLSTEKTSNRFNYVPSFYLNYDIKKSENLSLNYNVNRTFSDVTDMSSGYVLTNYNSLSKGNRSLESALYHNVSLNYYKFNMFNFENIIAFISYNKQLNAFKSDVEIKGINQINTISNATLANEILNGSLTYERKIGKIKLNSSVSYANFIFNNIVNAIEIESNSVSYNYKTSIRTLFKNAPNMEFGYLFSTNQYNNGDLKFIYKINSPFLKISSQFLKNFILTTTYDYYNYRDKEHTLLNTYEFIESRLTYSKKDSSWNFSIEGTNLLNTQSINSDSFNDLYSSTSKYIVQPRYLYFKVGYRL